MTFASCVAPHVTVCNAEQIEGLSMAGDNMHLMTRVPSVTSAVDNGAHMLHAWVDCAQLDRNIVSGYMASETSGLCAFVLPLDTRSLINWMSRNLEFIFPIGLLLRLSICRKTTHHFGLQQVSPTMANR